MKEFLRQYRLSKAREGLAIAEAEIAAIEGLLRNATTFTSYYADQIIGAKKRVAQLKYEISILDPKDPS